MSVPHDPNTWSGPPSGDLVPWRQQDERGAQLPRPAQRYDGAPIPSPPRPTGGPAQGYGSVQGYGPVHGYGPAQGYGGVPPVVVAMLPQKSTGVAVLLSFLWLGAGHLYAGSTVAGVLLLVFHICLVIVTLIPFAFLLTVPVWVLAFAIAAITAAGAVQRHNARNHATAAGWAGGAPIRGA